jgi:hypothetical protein
MHANVYFAGTIVAIPSVLSDTVKKWDISEGLPPDLPAPKLAFIDLAGLGVEEMWT